MDKKPIRALKRQAIKELNMACMDKDCRNIISCKNCPIVKKSIKIYGVIVLKDLNPII